MTLSASTAAAHVINASATTSVTLTPAANSLLVAFVAGDAGTGNTGEQLTVASTGLTWNLGIRANGTTDGSGNGATTEIWWANQPSSASRTVNVTDNLGSVGKSVKVVVFTDSGGGIPVFGDTDVNGASPANLNPVSGGAGSWAWSFGLSDANFTTVAGHTLQDHVDLADGFDGGDTDAVYSLDGLATGSGQNLTITKSRATFHFVAVSIDIPAGAAAIAPTTPQRRRVQTPPRRRPKATTPVPPQVVVPPFIPVQVKEARVLRGRLTRRGRVPKPVPAQVIVPPTIPTAARQPRRLRGLLPRRGHAVMPVPAQVSVAPPAYPPAPVRVRIKGAAARRPRNVMPPVDQAPAAVPQPPRRRGLLPRRGRTAAPVPAQVVAQAVAWVPQNVRERIRGFLARRGRTRTPVPPQVVIPPPPYPPQPVHGVRRGLRRRTHNVEGWMVGAAEQIRTTPRPFTGVTTYLTATTTRPGSGTTARPGSGTTTRPDTGITQDPC